jgi:hypothetical protein
MTDDQVRVRVTRARADISAILDQVLDNDDGLARIYAAHGRQPPPRRAGTRPGDDAGEHSGQVQAVCDRIAMVESTLAHVGQVPAAGGDGGDDLPPATGAGAGRDADHRRPGAVLMATAAPGVVRVRLSGTPGDIEVVAHALLDGAPAADGIELIESSALYPNRRDPGVRQYLTVRVTTAGQAPAPGRELPGSAPDDNHDSTEVGQ